MSAERRALSASVDYDLFTPFRRSTKTLKDVRFISRQVCLVQFASPLYYIFDSSMNTTVTTLDDRDPKFTYEGYWNKGGTVGNEFDGTTSWTNTSGSSATITLVGQCMHTNLGVFKN